MNCFETYLETRKIGYDKDGRPVHELLSDLIYLSDRFGRMLVPAGFVTNFASVPRLPVIFLVAGDMAHEQATLHDYLYTLRHGTRLEADEIFYEALLAGTAIPDPYDKKVPLLVAKAMYQAVRTFGQGSWDSESQIRQPQFISTQINESQREAA